MPASLVPGQIKPCSLARSSLGSTWSPYKLGWKLLELFINSCGKFTIYRLCIYVIYCSFIHLNNSDLWQK